MAPIPPTHLARLLAATFGGLGLGGLWLGVPVEEGWREGSLFGAGLGLGASFAAFELRRLAIRGKGAAHQIGLVAGFFLNLAFLSGGTILARYTNWLGHYQAFAFGYVGTVLLLGGLFTWALHREGIGRRRR